MSEPSSTRGLDRGGHLSELMLDRLRTDPPGAMGEAHANARLHLASCAACQAADAELVKGDAELAPPRARPLPSQRWPKLALAVATPLALAAIVLLIVRPPPSETDGMLRKSGAIDFEVYVHDGTKSRLVQSGDAVHPGDRVSFKVQARVAGHLLVVGSDEAGHAYRCWPQNEAVDAADAPAFGPTEGPEELPAAMRFDDVLGAEHLVAIFCAAPFSYADVAGPALVMQGDALLSDFRAAHASCAIRKVVLNKVRASDHE